MSHTIISYVLLALALAAVAGGAGLLFYFRAQVRRWCQSSWQFIYGRASGVYDWAAGGAGLLALKSEDNLVLGAIIDLLLAYIGVVLVCITAHIYLPLWGRIALALIIGISKYLWSVNLFRNQVPTYAMGVVTFIQRLTPTGPAGTGLMPGYYWFPLGWPFYSLLLKQPVKEISVLFENLQVWTKNAQVGGQGSIQGVLDGLAQFAIDDPGAYNAVENPFKVLEGITHEAARDVAEYLTAEDYLDKRNKVLGQNIFDDIKQKLSDRTRSLGVRCVSVSVKKTDNLDPEVKKSWAQITVQRSLVTARGIDAAGRVERIESYKKAGVDASRAIAADLVADEKTGATVGDQRYNGDVGPSLKDLGEGLVAVLARRIGGS